MTDQSDPWPPAVSLRVIMTSCAVLWFVIWPAAWWLSVLLEHAPATFIPPS